MLVSHEIQFAEEAEVLDAQLRHGVSGNDRAYIRKLALKPRYVPRFVLEGVAVLSEPLVFLVKFPILVSYPAVEVRPSVPANQDDVTVGILVDYLRQAKRQTYGLNAELIEGWDDKYLALVRRSGPVVEFVYLELQAVKSAFRIGFLAASSHIVVSGKKR